MVGLQWGDEGKGKIVDYLAGGFEAVARFSGGSNAGHTVVIGGRKHTFHLVPSGALKGKELLVGAGVAVDPVVLGEELALLPDETRRRLLVDGRCSLVSPLDKEFDRVLEGMRGASAIGTTMRGVGPAYAMRALRISPRVTDIRAGFDFEPLVRFYRKFDIDAAGLPGWAEDSKRLLSSLEGDVGGRVADICDRGGSVLFEASQGSLLDLLHGSYPYVTSTHTATGYIPAALGIDPSLAGTALGVMKCYTTRVGGGPFPTEITGALGESLRGLGNEYGATTGRPRRVGWLDLVALRYAIRLNGVKEVVLSKLDVLSKLNDLKVCVAYRHGGEETADFQSSLGHLGEVEPVYETPLQVHGARFDSGLPAEGKRFVEYLEKKLGVKVALVSYGEERSMTIEL
ncbi:MAG: adenylosuccinate synthetase [Nitrososphaerota archaeon]|nr:adenylosuccinate synthetase [Nitrososphaerota archaeon]MDG7024332.1 adenylosuccinate synthetase [Nitrososphaerota archaeon]